MLKYKYVILGGGITGLSCANFLKDEDYCIIEKESTVGGYCKTIYKDGFVWDYAGHFFHFKDEDNQLFFEKVFQDNKIVRKNKNTHILYKDKYIDYPFQCNIHQLEQSEFIDCLYDLYFRDSSIEENNFKEMLYCKFGRGIAEKFLIPYNEKLYACDLDTLDTSAMGRFFPYATLDDIVKNFKVNNFSTYNDEFIYPENGAQVFINFLNGNLDEKRIFLDREIVGIDSAKQVITTNQETIEYEYLISTIPLPGLLDYLQIGKEYNDIWSYNKVLVLNLGFDRPIESIDSHWIYLPDKEVNFYRLGFYSNIIDAEKLSMYVEIGFSKDAEIDIEKEKHTAIEKMRELGIISNHELIASTEIIMDPAYVHISNEGEKTKEELIPELIQKNIYIAGRYGRWTYCSMEDCVNQAKEIVGLIRKG